MESHTINYYHQSVVTIFPIYHFPEILEALTQMSQNITVPVTFIRSFKYRTTCYLPLSNIPQSATVKDLFDRIHHGKHYIRYTLQYSCLEVKTSSVIPPPFKNLCYGKLISSNLTLIIET